MENIFVLANCERNRMNRLIRTNQTNNKKKGGVNSRKEKEASLEIHQCTVWLIEGILILISKVMLREVS